MNASIETGQSADVEEQHGPLVVGIGASAGGLAVLRELFDGLPSGTGLAFVIVVHLSPDHESHLAELLQAHCSMPVQQVTAAVPLEADHVYVIAPGRNLNTIDSHLRVSELPADAAHRAPIDHFFRTLASTHGERAVGIVLTGTGSDGTAGLEEVKHAGGLTIVQDPEEAEFDGMPRAAITSGYIDQVLKVAEIPERVLRFARTKPPLELVDGTTSEDGVPSLQDVLDVVRARTGHDVSGYKQATILRRLRRRMQMHGCEQMDEYLEVLDHEADEAHRLFRDLLISVTNFFRDPDVFEHLEREVIPALLEGKGPGDTVRIWSVGCSTGEEPYTLAILFLEATRQMEQPPMVQVFATDLHDTSLQRARDGLYPELIGGDVSQDRLRRFFTREPNGYRVRKEVRELVVFAPHDLLRDPPFSHLDMVSCRNVLIYLQRDLQQKVIGLFHYALDPGGYLVLGTSESIERSDLFTVQEKTHRVFRCRDVDGPEPALPIFPSPGARTRRRSPSTDHTRHLRGFGRLHEQVVEQYAPPSVLVNADHHVLHYSAQAGSYLVHPGGDPTTDVVRLVREELRIDLRAALHSARETGTPTTSAPIPLVVDGEPQQVVIRVRPADDRVGLSALYLVIFDDVGGGPPPGSSESTGLDIVPDDVETELDLTKHRLQGLISEYEVSQADMRASNEEMQSTNEELRSTLEELETSKEELQSVNEELTTLNQENRHKVDELRLLSGDLHNLLVGTDIATLFLDRDLRILRFTPRIGDLFNILQSDRGRPLSDLTHRLGYEGLHDDAADVLERLVPIEREVQSDDDRWYVVRVLPYRSSDDRIEGVVITFIDITRRRLAEVALRDSEQRLRLALDASQMGAWTWDARGDVLTTDERVSEIVGLSAGETTMSELLDQLVRPDDRRALQSALDRAVQDPDGHPFSLEVRLRRDDASTIWALVSGRGYATAEDPDRIDRVTGTVLDVTDRRETEQSLTRRVRAQTEAVRHTERRFRALVEASAQIVWSTDAHGFLVEDSPQWRAFTGQTFDELRGAGWLDAIHQVDRPLAASTWHRAIEESAPFHAEFRIQHQSSGDWHWVSARAVPLRRADGPVQGWVGMITDIDHRRRAEEKVRVLASTLTMAEHEERRRIAQVLHDDLQQRLYSVQMRVGLLREQADATAVEETVQNLREIEEWVASSVDLTHRLTVEISPPIFEHEGLTESLEWLGSHMRELHDLSVAVHATDSFVIGDEDMRVFLFQIVRELLFNVVKHADVDEARVDLTRDGPDLTIAVTDRGGGFDPQTVEGGVGPAGGMGLSSARERLALFGGAMDVYSRANDVTVVRITIPLPVADR